MEGFFFLLFLLKVLDAKEAQIVLAASTLEHVREVAEADRAVILELVALFSHVRLQIDKSNI